MKVFALSKLFFVLAFFSLVYVTTCAAYATEGTGAASRKETIKQRVETRKETMATRAAALKEKLKNFRDQKKASAAARISDNLNRINDKQTSQMLKHLDKTASILDRLEARVNSVKPDIKNPDAAKISIANARSKIASAEAAVKAQADNDYTLILSSESKAREEAQALRQKLHSDLRLVRQTVIDAKQSVSAAIRAAKEGVNSGTQ